MLTTAAEVAKYAISEHFVAFRDDTKGTVAISPIGWVGEPALVIPESKLADLSVLLKQL